MDFNIVHRYNEIACFFPPSLCCRLKTLWILGQLGFIFKQNRDIPRVLNVVSLNEIN